MDIDVRWIQRYRNYVKAFNSLLEAVETATERDLNKLERQGLIQVFEYTYELSWKVIKDYFESKGETEIMGSRDAFLLAFERGLVQKGAYLMDSIKSRQLTVHTYNEETADQIYADIMNKYCHAFEELVNVLAKEAEK